MIFPGLLAPAFQLAMEETMTKVIALIALLTNGQTMIWVMPETAMEGCELAREALLLAPLVAAAKCTHSSFNDLTVPGGPEA